MVYKDHLAQPVLQDQLVSQDRQTALKDQQDLRETLVQQVAQRDIQEQPGQLVTQGLQAETAMLLTQVLLVQQDLDQPEQQARLDLRVYRDYEVMLVLLVLLDQQVSSLVQLVLQGQQA